VEPAVDRAAAVEIDPDRGARGRRGAYERKRPRLQEHLEFARCELASAGGALSAPGRRANSHEALRDGQWRDDRLILDDQALVVSLSERGHAGIDNTVRYARKLTGTDAVAAIVAGFHLSGPMFERTIEPTVNALAALSPSLLDPAHCTGWKAVHRLATRFPDQFVMSTVGATITL
jgi:metal-dependent hydrolase (beta-lactamase superfamily II)